MAAIDLGPVTPEQSAMALWGGDGSSESKPLGCLCAILAVAGMLVYVMRRMFRGVFW